MGSGMREYLSDMWNVFEQLQFFLTSLTLLMHLSSMEIHNVKVVAALAIFMMYIKLFYWLRLFESSAAFIRMIKEIINDCVPFGVFLFVCVAMFSNTLLLFDQSRRLEGIDGMINGPVFGIPWIDAFVRSYLVGLGEFDMENFSNSDGAFVWILFILATFITQLLFMNLLIAIMGDTFDRVQEMKVQAGTKEKISMITDFIWVLDMSE